MVALFIILAFYLLGSLISWATGGLLPASIAGMILLFVALSTGWLKAEKVKVAADFLLSNLMLFFVPVAVGVFWAFALFSDHLWAIIVSSLASTVIVIAVVGITAQLLIRKKQHKQ